MVSVTNWEKPDSADVVMKSITDLVSQYQGLSSSASDVSSLLPREVIQYVEDGRNPDIYTREFVEIVLKYNQLMNGKRKAYERFYKVLNDQMLTAFPELTEEIEKVRLNTVARK
ncbi:mediator complex, subunit Med10 [Pyronema omphalodes]|nr:mediator complex, subunit Med10 [Pyronema omphalodes]